MEMTSYGNMATSNSIGSQITNICVGLGVPWLISVAINDKPVEVSGHKNLFVAAIVQACNVTFNVCLVLGEALVMGRDKAVLNRPKG